MQKRKVNLCVYNSSKIATQSLQNDKPGEFFDVTYAITEELTRGKSKVTVRFQAKPNNTAGGLYGVRIVRRDQVKSY